ncbi:MAG: hypothetical protein HY712_07950 [candidate division NC10 bacterium]|nr:hypothetical protein [candidate division NC10 bacterium]
MGRDGIPRRQFLQGMSVGLAGPFLTAGGASRTARCGVAGWVEVAAAA